MTIHLVYWHLALLLAMAGEVLVTKPDHLPSEGVEAAVLSKLGLVGVVVVGPLYWFRLLMR